MLKINFMYINNKRLFKKVIKIVIQFRNIVTKG